MSRRRKVYKKEEKVDSRYGSPAVARLISTVMKRGKKSLAERIVYTAIDKSREGTARRGRDLSSADGSCASAANLARHALDRAIRR